MPHASQVSLALFTNSADEQNRTLSHDSFGLNRLSQGDQRYEAATVVGDSRREQSVITPHDGKIRVLRKHCIEMRADDNQRRLRSAFDQSDRKSTRLNSSHLVISYAVFCLKKKTHY